MANFVCLEALTSRKVAGVAEKALGVSLAGAARGADLGGSSKYSRRSPGGPKWRMVSCKQQLNMSESVLSHGGNLDQMCGAFSLFILLERNGRKTAM